MNLVIFYSSQYIVEYGVLTSLLLFSEPLLYPHVKHDNIIYLFRDWHVCDIMPVVNYDIIPKMGILGCYSYKRV